MYIFKLHHNFLLKKKEFLSKGRYLPVNRHNSFALLNLSRINNHLQSASSLFNYSFKIKYLLLLCRIIFKNKIYIKNDGQFITYLKHKLKLSNISSSIIPSSNNKKDILFLTSNNRKVIIKISNDKLHNNLIENEYKNTSKNLIYDSFFKKPVIVIKGYFDNRFYIGFEYYDSINYKFNDILYLYEKSLSKYIDKLPTLKLDQHPFVKHLINQLDRSNLLKYKKILIKISNATNNKYYIVNIHGDFITENILKVDNKFILIDYECYAKNGIEGLDKIKYLFHYYYFKIKLPFNITFFIIQKKVGKVYFPILFIFFLTRLIDRLKNNLNVKKEIYFIEFLIKHYEKKYI